jgi:hypothetical protein
MLEDQKKIINTLVVLRKKFSVTAIIDIEDHANIVILAYKVDRPNLESIKPYINKLECTYDLGFTKALESIQWLKLARACRKTDIQKNSDLTFLCLCF